MLIVTVFLFRELVEYLDWRNSLIWIIEIVPFLAIALIGWNVALHGRNSVKSALVYSSLLLAFDHFLLRGGVLLFNLAEDHVPGTITGVFLGIVVSFTLFLPLAMLSGLSGFYVSRFRTR